MRTQTTHTGAGRNRFFLVFECLVRLWSVKFSCTRLPFESDWGKGVEVCMLVVLRVTEKKELV